MGSRPAVIGVTVIVAVRRGDWDLANGGAPAASCQISITMFAAVRDAICSLFDDSYRFYCPVSIVR